MADKPERNAFTQMAMAIAEAVAEIGADAVSDIRNKWEEAWFGRALTPETGRGMERFADQLEDLTERLGTATAEIRGLAREVEPMGGRVGSSWEDMCAQLAKERGYQPAPELERDRGIDL